MSGLYFTNRPPDPKKSILASVLLVQKGGYYKAVAKLLILHKVATLR